MERSQRERLLAAVVRVSAANGYRSTSVADILSEAGVGRESFYEHFKDKENCFLAANDLLIDDLSARVTAAYEKPGSWPDRVQGGLAVILDWLSADPDVARVMMVEMGTVGPPVASQRFRDTFSRFTALLDDGREFIESAPDLPNLAHIAGGGIYARIYEEVALSRTADLPRLLPQLSFELLLPYIGEEAAREAANTAAAADGLSQVQP